MPTFQLTGSNGTSVTVSPEGKPVTFGRHADNAVCLNDERLSRFHCIVEPDGEGGIRVRDLGSRNGTKVNGLRVTDAPLTTGDVLKLGSHEFTVEAEATLKERQAEARLKAPLSDAPWMSDLRELIDMLPPKGGLDDKVTMIDGRGKPSEALHAENAGPVAVRLLLLAASKSRATDIHIEPKGDTAHVRLRVDGQMVSILDLPNQVCELAYGLIKNACQFQAAGKEAVLDGHISTRIQSTGSNGAAGGRRVDYRISFTPSMHGQKLVVRILDARDAPKNLGEVDLPPYMYDRIRKVCQQDAGMLMVCGPTGSGKTTTLYNALREIDRATKNVVTIEDPVEYHIEGVTQIPIDERRGNTFGSLLRSVLRQDPDVILVGEIRDEETARTAMQAAMTGHLVFSTVHAKDTMSSVFRLLDLKVEAYLVANSLEVILAQRLVRLLCENCKRAVPVSPAQATRMGRYLENQKQVYVATGCQQCLRTGYRGRRAIFELLDFTDELRDVVLGGATIQSMKKVIESGLFTTLVQSGWQLVARGVTTLEEVDRVATVR
ncbi:MAG: Flp pilus assembly complex ATPase component TadA [Phycisphaeraceae bacterium]|nr:Flp pilus assembly complex ATPase component TadA [Phycisphaeraceae bacterium]